MAHISNKKQVVSLLALASLSLGVLLVIEPCPALGQAKDKKKRDADIARYVKQMSDVFSAWDLNKDGVLDKDELAKALRGKNAKAYDYQPDPPPAKKPAPRVTMVALVTLPRAGLAINAAAAGLVTRNDAIKAEKDAATPTPLSPDVYQGYPDYQFLVVAGSKDKLAKQDFDNWAKKYAGLFEDRYVAQQAVKAASDKLAKAKTTKEKNLHQMDVLKHQQEVQNAQAQIDLIPVAVQKAMNLKH